MLDPMQVPQKRQPVTGKGRHLDPALDSAILNAALEGLADQGYDRLTMDEVAARAHAGKGAIYRRWPSKAALVVDAVVSWRTARASLEAPDTGSLRGDLDAIVDSIQDFGEGDQPMVRVILGLVTAAGQDDELAAALDANVLEVPRRVFRQIFDRAVARGEIPADRDLSLLPDMIMGLNVVSFVTRRTINRAYVRRVLDEFVIPLALGRTEG
jgi:AcrR family transcriptional regulator